MPLLSHSLVGPDDPARRALVIHGILGSKSNWRSLAKQLADALPGWGFALVDLRNHGESQGYEAPHTLDAVTDDLRGLSAHLGSPFDAVIGHSYGGKASLALVRALGGAIDHAVIIDANPGARPEQRGTGATLTAVDTLEALGEWHDTRDAFLRAALARGHDRSMVVWLAMNLVHDGGRFRLRVDPSKIRAMLDAYFTTDLWPVVESPPGRVKIRFVMGGRSPVMDQGERERLDRSCANNPGRVSVSTVPEAGHWVHVDAPAATLGLIVDALGGP